MLYRTALVFLLSSTSHAATLIVDTTSDSQLDACIDLAPADCSLRGAIERANALPGADVIHFAMTESDAGYQVDTAHWRISAASALPNVLDALVIDGLTQPGAAPNAQPSPAPIAHVLKIEVRGPNNADDGFTAYAPLTLRGLVLNQWRRAVFQFNPGPNVVEGNHIGVDISGQTAVPNGTGITLGGDVRVGGTNPAQRNVIAANRDYGLSTQYGLTRLRIQGNIIGASADLTAVPGRQDFGMYLLDPRDTQIGGATAAEGNTISGNGFSAIAISASGFQTTDGIAHARVQGNRIGIGLDDRALGNGRASNFPAVLVGIGGFCRVLIGGDGPGEGNVIAHNRHAGVAIGSCWRAPIVGNVFTGNHGIAIDLAGSNGFDGPTDNDTDDADAPGTDPVGVYGGNRFQNHPIITLPADFVADGGGSSVALSYVVDSAPAFSSYPLTVHFHRGGCHGGGRELIASDTYGESDAQQPRAFLLEGDGNILPLTALAVDADGNTSEFSTLVGDPVFVDGLETDPATFGPGRCD
ncbi:MAG TPA: hypothetical protein VN581_05490 [Patescibacteria group bacterium]|nr:hypothetical protein [Patescibacteria group bacterium]